MWIGDGKAAVVMPAQNSAILIHAREGNMYIVNHGSKQYAQVPVDLKEALAGTAEMAKEEDVPDSVADTAMKTADSMSRSLAITVTPTDETRQIGEWNAKKYNVTTELGMVKLVAETWATEDLKADNDLYHICSIATMAQAPSFDRMCRELQKIKGVPVEQVGTINMMGTVVETRNKIIDHADKDAPAGTYDIPEDYRLVDFKSTVGSPAGR
jgi:hypothetical protein